MVSTTTLRRLERSPNGGDICHGRQQTTSGDPRDQPNQGQEEGVTEDEASQQVLRVAGHREDSRWRIKGVDDSPRTGRRWPDNTPEYPDTHTRRCDAGTDRSDLLEHGEAPLHDVTNQPWPRPVSVARKLAAELSGFRRPLAEGHVGADSGARDTPDLAAEFDRRIVDPDLRDATRTRFLTSHYADAVESGVKALCECIRSRTGSTEDGDALITAAFSPNNPLLRINRGRSRNDQSEQRGHMFLCQGVVGAWRNPRAHALIEDSPVQALMMLETLDYLITKTKTATRTRGRSAT